jgi:hypothetical protein
VIERELNDKEMAIRLIGWMDNRVTLGTIVRRLKCLEAAIEMAGMMVGEKLLTQEQASDWLLRYVRSYDPTTRTNIPAPASEHGAGREQ